MSDKEPENTGADTNAAAARPTGKRQLAGVNTASSSTAQTAKPQQPEGEGKSGNAVLQFFPQVVEEMRKVVWPTSKQMLQYTMIVFAFLILMTALVAGVDFIAGLGVEKVLTS